MSLEAAIKARIAAHAGLTALVSGRVFNTYVSPLPTRPYLIVRMIDGPGRARSMGNGATLIAQRVQVTVISESASSEIAVHAQVMAALDWLTGTFAGTAIELSYAEGAKIVLPPNATQPDLRESSQDFIFHYRVA
jgi:hypothetical protein